MSAPVHIAEAEQPFRRRVRRLRGFLDSFQAQVQNTSAQTGIVYDIDEEALTATFLSWIDAFNAQKPADDSDNMAFVGFAAGLMLKTLIKHAPATVVSLPEGASEDEIAYFWPEGYLYVAYCLNIRGSVLEQDFHVKQELATDIDDIRTWWSFREDVRNDPSLAVAFLDYFSGQEPNWTTPEIFRSQRFRAVARKVYSQIEE